MKKFFRNKSGATAIEYGLMIGLLALVIITAVGGVGNKTQEKFESVAAAFP